MGGGSRQLRVSCPIHPEPIHPDKITPLEKHNLKTDVNAVSHPVLISQSSSVNELPIQ